MDDTQSTEEQTKAEEILPADSERARELLSEGWSVRWRSFGAALSTSEASVAQFDRFFEGLPEAIEFRELTAHDVENVLTLARATADDYPGGPATRPAPLSLHSATPTAVRIGFGAFEDRADLVAITFLDVLETGVLETDFTVVTLSLRGRGVGTALKAYSIVKMTERGMYQFRTGGAAENAAIWAANKVLGYRIDEEWLTLTRG